MANRIRLWLRAQFKPGEVESEIREELLHHLELEIQKNLRNGMNEREARRKAMVDFGGVERFQEQTRDARTTRPLEDLLADLRHAFRGLRKSPGFTTVTVLTLALGIGANTAIFSVVSGVLLKPLPYPEPEDLVYINSYFAPESGYDFADYPVGSPEYFDYRNQNRTMEEVAAVSTELITLSDGDGEPEVIAAGWVSPSMFTVLRTPPLLGRTLIEEDGGPDPTKVVVLSFDLWQSRFGGDPNVVGRQICLGMELSENVVRAEVVGVMPYGFGYPDRRAKLWGPLPLDPARTWRGGHWFDMMGRLAPGVAFEEAQSEMASIMEQWAVTYPDHHLGHGLQMRPLLDERVGDARSSLLLLMASVGLVLLIACANVASLLLARAEGRRMEVAIRSALGAGRGRLTQQVLTESLVLATLGGILGLLLASFGVKALLLLEAGTIPRVEEIGLDARILLFVGGGVLLTTFLFGLVPALQEAAPKVANAFREVGLRTTSSASRMRFRRWLVVGELALSVFLVVGAGLMLRSFRELLREDPGFDTENILFARFSLPAGSYEPLEANLFFDRLLEQTRALPDVVGATLTSRPPLLWNDQSGRIQIEGRPVAATAPMCCVSSIVDVGDGFFQIMGLPLVRGRYLEPTDHLSEAPGVVVVDEAFASRWFPGEDPIGKRVRAGNENSPWLPIVGVVGSVTYDGPGELWPTYYLAHNLTATYAPFMSRSSYLMVRAGGDAAGVLPAIREVVRRLDPNLAIAGSYTMGEILGQAVARPRFIMSVLSVFASVALILGVIGIYGVMSYGVALRAGEMGIRRALGAEEGAVVALILRQGLVMTASGLALGIVGAALASRVLEGFLHQVSPTDPLTYVAVAVGVLLVAFLASWLPARRASGVDPVEALRME